MTLTAEPGAGEVEAVAPEAFDGGRPLPFWGGLFRPEGVPDLDAADAARAVRASLNEHRTWSFAPLTERKLRVLASLDALTGHRDLLASLPGVGPGLDECLEETRRCVEQVDGLLAGREPLRGPVTNLADRGCPAPVLVYAMFVQALVGNAVVVKAPEEAGHALALVTALAARHGVPFTLVHGGGPMVDAALTRPDVVGCVSYPDGTRRGLSLVGAVTRRAAI
ncbi:hypothetical protein DI005_13360 [Prauserella sp. PE36]|uniref:aldehyde dehydrogenase family protein n=1 Tax=Prauserella sp. PE36 TaxID=1504709 RepID=UPI000DE2871D|nr:aldehyde dehydrogenase family protein [Prauserella sp. PE36]RBM20343.1 hypothetical protein DI005_13360 [Prauserella sp. PE36]